MNNSISACVYPAGNCLPDVVVSRLHAPDMGRVFTALRSAVQADIIAAFSTHRNMLQNYMDGNEVVQVISGTLRATATNGEHGCQFIVLSDANGTIISAYPMFEEQ